MATKEIIPLEQGWANILTMLNRLKGMLRNEFKEKSTGTKKKRNVEKENMQ